jgi:hypothetical protein
MLPSQHGFIALLAAADLVHQGIQFLWCGGVTTT